MAIKQIEDSLSDRGIVADSSGVTNTDFNTSQTLQAYQAGRMSYDPDCKCHLADTGYSNVRVNMGRESHIQVFNDTGVQIDNGKPVSFTLAVDATTSLPKIALATSSDITSVLTFAGITTMDIPDGQAGIVTKFGRVNGVDTSLLSTGFLYLGPGGTYTQTRPQYPENRLAIGAVLKVDGTNGVIGVNPDYISRRSTSRTYPFTSATVAAGTSYQAGFYDWAATSVTLNQGSLTQTFGTAGRSRAAHAGIVPSGPGTVDTGQVGLRVTGILDSETGPQIAAQTGIITDDITTLTANVMAETSEKFSGQITYELYTVSGTPTAYSLTFNYGYSKYEDVLNTDGTVVGIDCVWEAGAADTGFNIELLHHKATGWTYAASGFVPGNGAIAERLVDQQLASNIAIGVSGAWKRVGLNTFIEGSADEGIVIRITTGANNSIRNLTMHLSAFSEELS